MLTDLADRVFVVTGAGRGIGAAVASALAAEGAVLGLIDRDAESIAAAEQRAHAAGAKAVAWAIDISDEAQVGRAMTEIAAGLGGIQGVANVAGVNSGDDGPVADVAAEVFDRILAVNLRGTFLCCKHALPHLLDGGGGTIVNVSSAGALPGIKNGGATAYNASKAGILGLTRSLASQYAEQNVRCVAVCPGPVATAMLEVARDKLGHAALHPPRTLPRAAEPAEIADLVVFLLSGRGSYVSGSTWAIDGNLTGY
jgi:NAD(P)-dependent dehydrogenase (short-subunit alcohol dehydrogenase family)